ncbi:ATP-binding protein [Ornithinibacillus bavariensis]|uniref:ATPase YjoB n=1 Tax=Ornithinibacillus bavariensis TaxID=545502 RepID=A0A919X6L4_9BACI|nr:AAA family ATPase [Ornithinibacillus bavariensis]GIO25823.1 putative ATPase YjoB [Ornithinibacillus bavariensis]HAM79766.1 ATPase [Ornithinibacillus sp.]
MRKVETLIKYENPDSRKLHYYYQYTFAINKVIEFLNEKYGFSFQLYNTERRNAGDFNEIISDILQNKPEELELVASVYDSFGHADILPKDNGKHEIKPSSTNNIYYFSVFDIAIVTLPVYSYGHPFTESYLFGKNDGQVLDFLQYIDDLERQFMLDGITVFTDTDEGLTRSKEKITQQIAREDVLLEDRIKTDIFRSIDEFFLHSGTFFKTYHIPYKRGILLYGSPGNGKTTLVKSIAGSVAAPIVYWQITEFTSSYSISEIFSKVVRLAPMVLVIEDIDSMPEESRSVFLNTLDGATSKEGIFLIGTTNYPEKIDPALINRAGRFDRAYEIKQPSDILRKNYLLKKGISQFIEENQLEKLISKTKGLSIAQLNEVYMSIALDWHYEKQVDIDKIVNDLQVNQKKVQKQDWVTDDISGRVGF